MATCGTIWRGLSACRSGADRRQLGAELAERQPLFFAKSQKRQTMLEAKLVANHTLQMKLGWVGWHYEFHRDHASQWDWLGKEDTQSAFCDVVAVPFDAALAEADRDR